MFLSISAPISPPSHVPMKEAKSPPDLSGSSLKVLTSSTNDRWFTPRENPLGRSLVVTQSAKSTVESRYLCVCVIISGKTDVDFFGEKKFVWSDLV